MSSPKLKLLGAFEAQDSAGRIIAIKSRKCRALVAALALAPSQTMPREYLAGLLWSERDEEQARSSLRQALVALRKDFARSHASFLLVKDMNVAIDLTRLQIDVVEFLRHAQSSDLGTLRRAITLYDGDLLSDLHIEDPVFNEWVNSERRRLADIATTVLEKLCTRETGEAQIDAAKKIVALDPLREGPHRILMQHYHEVGETALAFRQYEYCQQILRDELQVAPSEETETLYRHLRTTVERLKTGSKGPHDGTVLPHIASFSADKPLVVVLPLANPGNVPHLERFCGGLTEDVTVGLSRISSIRLTTHKATPGDKQHAMAIASLYGARYILQGSARISANATRVTAQLIDAISGHHLWAQQTNLPEAEATFPDDLTRSIVASVQTQIILNEGHHHLIGSDADSVPGLLARSWHRFLLLTEESLVDARALSERALKLDTGHGTAHRMRAAALYHQIYMGFVPWVQPTIDAIYMHAKSSVESDEADEYSHWAMECAHLLRKEHELAITSLHRALEINPNCSLAIGSMGTVLAWNGQADASVKSNELALHLNPQDPSNFFRHLGLALAHYLAHRYDKAVVHARMVVQVRPGWQLAQIIYAASLAQSQRPDEGARILANLQSSGAKINMSWLNLLPFARMIDREHLIRGLIKTGGLRLAFAVHATDDFNQPDR